MKMSGLLRVNYFFEKGYVSFDSFTVFPAVVYFT